MMTGQKTLLVGIGLCLQVTWWAGCKDDDGGDNPADEYQTWEFHGLDSNDNIVATATVELLPGGASTGEPSWQVLKQEEFGCDFWTSFDVQFSGTNVRLMDIRQNFMKSTCSDMSVSGQGTGVTDGKEYPNALSASGTVTLNYTSPIGPGGGTSDWVAYRIDQDDGDDDDDDDAQPDEEYVRNMSVWVLVDSIFSLHNRYITGTSCGSQVALLDQACLSGGTVSITGSVDCGTDQPEQRNLVYTFNNCAEAEENGLITFVDGECRQQGSWVEGDYQQMAYSGTATMQMTLFIEHTNYPVDYQACAYSISEEMNNGDWSYAGLLCGEPFSW